MIREAPLRYVAVFRVEADNIEALEKALEYVAKRLETAKVVYACGPGPHVCFCKAIVEWDGELLTVRSCLKSAIEAVVNQLLDMYYTYRGKSIWLVKYKEYKL
jgi:hypothetical protein